VEIAGDRERAEVWQFAPRVSIQEGGLAYYRSIWGEEVSIYREIPKDAIIGKVP
jgi:hypothetical protein